MKKNKILVLGAAAAAFATIAAGGAQDRSYNIGRPATPEEIRQRDISVMPDGTGLPVGHGTVAEGQLVYQIKCANCHGGRGEGAGEYPALAGGRGTLKDKNPVLTVGSFWPYATTVWDYIHRAMPYQRPGSLTADETYAVTTYILYLNGIVEEKARVDEKSLAGVKMPNRDGFVGDPRPDVGSKKTGTATESK